MFIMLPPLLYGQNKLVEESIIYSSDISSYKKKIEKTIFFDTETNLPVFELILDTARSSKMYTSYYFRKRLREVSTEISYIGGNESLRKYQDSLYWENYNGDEQNASCLYTGFSNYYSSILWMRKRIAISYDSQPHISNNNRFMIIIL